MGGGQLVGEPEPTGESEPAAESEPTLVIYRQRVVYVVNGVRLTTLRVNVLLLHAAGLTDPEAAQWLNKSQKSIAAVRRDARVKLGLSDRQSFQEFAAAHMRTAFDELCTELNTWLSPQKPLYPIDATPVPDTDWSPWQALRDDGMSVWRIAALSGRDRDTVRRHTRGPRGKSKEQ